MGAVLVVGGLVSLLVPLLLGLLLPLLLLRLLPLLLGLLPLGTLVRGRGPYEPWPCWGR